MQSALITSLLVLSVAGAPSGAAASDAAVAGATKKAGTAAGASTTPADATAQDDDPDRDVNRAQPDFTLVGLPTTLRLPSHKSAFRITHRFGRPLGQGDFGDLASDFFGLDSGAAIGFEYRYGLMRATQLAVHRTNNRTIQFLLQRQIKGQAASFPLSIDVIGSVEGTDNFRDVYSPGVGVVVSREVGDRAAVYVEPIWVHNTNPLPDDVAADNDSLLAGLGARLRLSASVYGVVELTPRLAGYDPGKTQVALGLEKRAGGHSFQLNVGNGFGTTFAQIARGGNDDWYLGFNISRKFY